MHYIDEGTQDNVLDCLRVEGSHVYLTVMHPEDPSMSALVHLDNISIGDGVVEAKVEGDDSEDPGCVNCIVDSEDPRAWCDCLESSDADHKGSCKYKAHQVEDCPLNRTGSSGVDVDGEGTESAFSGPNGPGSVGEDGSEGSGPERAVSQGRSGDVAKVTVGDDGAHVLIAFRAGRVSMVGLRTIYQHDVLDAVDSFTERVRRAATAEWADGGVHVEFADAVITQARLELFHELSSALGRRVDEVKVSETKVRHELDAARNALSFARLDGDATRVQLARVMKRLWESTAQTPGAFDEIVQVFKSARMIRPGQDEIHGTKEWLGIGALGEQTVDDGALKSGAAEAGSAEDEEVITDGGNNVVATVKIPAVTVPEAKLPVRAPRAGAGSAKTAARRPSRTSRKR